MDEMAEGQEAGGTPAGQGMIVTVDLRTEGERRVDELVEGWRLMLRREREWAIARVRMLDELLGMEQTIPKRMR